MNLDFSKTINKFYVEIVEYRQLFLQISIRRLTNIRRQIDVEYHVNLMYKRDNTALSF